MGLLDLEERLLERLSGSRLRSGDYAAAEHDDGATTLAELVAVGLDTNVLKQLRRDRLRADAVLVKVRDASLSIIVPEQAVIEFWNNHHVFAREDWSQFAALLGKLKTKLTSLAPESDSMARVLDIERAIAEIGDELEDSQSAEYLSRSRSLMESLLPSATRPMVSRSRFAGLANARHYSKTPPGFADEQRKSAALGDFFMWCDFLLGAMAIAEKESSNCRFVWVTEESKPDWKTGGQGHPSLVEEFDWVCGAKLTITTLRDFEALLAVKAHPRRAEADNTPE